MSLKIGEPMDTAPKIESADLSIEQVYKDFYVVPPYQREYVWSESDVQIFADDIYDELYGTRGELLQGKEYFIGSIVVCRDNEKKVFELIDGQQRMTTIYLFLCAIRDVGLAYDGGESRFLDQMIRHYRRVGGAEVSDYRLTLQYEDSRGILERIANRDKSEPTGSTTKSMVAIQDAYETLCQFLAARFKEKQDIEQFFDAFIQRVKLIRIVTPNLAHALKVFETVNDRGVGLTALDLLKNLLFMRTAASEYEELNQHWKDLTAALEKCGEKPLRFLRYFVLASYPNFRTGSGKPVREDELYDWFTRNEEAIGISKKPIDFALLLLKAARDYSAFAEARAPDGTEIVYLDNIQRLSGKARQHLILMLAARHLPADALTLLAQHLESLFFVFVVTKEQTKNFEWMFGDWAADVRSARTAEDVLQAVSKHIRPLVAKKSQDFDSELNKLSSEDIQKYRLKYILAKLAQYVDRIAWQDAASVQRLKHYLDSKLEIEHILPQKPDLGEWLAFDKPEEQERYIQKLGNLSLLEKPLNAAVCNKSFKTKLAAYRDSKVMLTRAIGDPEIFGKNTSLQRALGLLADATMSDADGQVAAEKTWTSVQIDQRQRALVRLARVVWLVDQACAVDVAAAFGSAPTQVIEPA